MIIVIIIKKGYVFWVDMHNFNNIDVFMHWCHECQDEKKKIFQCKGITSLFSEIFKNFFNILNFFLLFEDDIDAHEIDALKHRH